MYRNDGRSCIGEKSPRLSHSLVYIVIVNWNNHKDTISCLSSIARLNCQNIKVIVCDNDSSDNSKFFLSRYISEQRFSNISVVSTGCNGGYAFGVNHGIGIALADPNTAFIWILNNDTIVLPDTLFEMISKMNSDVKLGMVGSILLNRDLPNQIQSAGGSYNKYLGTTHHFFQGELITSTLLKSIGNNDPDYLVGASILITKACAMDLGPMNTAYFLYYEDVDWCKRAINKGYRLVVSEKSFVLHSEGASTGLSSRNITSFNANRMYKIYYRSCLLYSRIHHPKLYALIRLSMILRMILPLLKANHRKSIAALYVMLFVWPGQK